MRYPKEKVYFLFDLKFRNKTQKKKFVKPNISINSGLKGKIVFDENDPQRPRFSLPELRDILQERNALKARVSDLEDELAVFRPRPPQQQSS